MCFRSLYYSVWHLVDGLVRDCNTSETCAKDCLSRHASSNTFAFGTSAQAVLETEVGSEVGRIEQVVVVAAAVVKSSADKNLDKRMTDVLVPVHGRVLDNLGL